MPLLTATSAVGLEKRCYRVLLNGVTCTISVPSVICLMTPLSMQFAKLPDKKYQTILEAKDVLPNINRTQAAERAEN